MSRLPEGRAAGDGGDNGFADGDEIGRGVADLLADHGADGTVAAAARPGGWRSVRVTFAPGSDPAARRRVASELWAIFLRSGWYECSVAGDDPADLLLWYVVRPRPGAAD